MENNLQDGRMSKEAARWFIYMTNDLHASASYWIMEKRGNDLTEAWAEFWYLFHEIRD